MNENLHLFAFISLFISFGKYVQRFFDVVRKQFLNKKNLLESINRRSKVHGKNMSRDGSLNLNQS